MCIGSHTATHPDLTRCGEDRLARETAGSKRLIEERLGIPVRHFAYPWGRFDARVLSHVRQAGYETGAAVSVNPAGPLQPWDAFTLSRVTAHPAATELELIRSVAFRNLARRTLSQLRRNADARSCRTGLLACLL
jgi:peptidoglycan/xylan/chitin deacetylase (PgdA/CDA1 family)